MQYSSLISFLFFLLYSTSTFFFFERHRKFFLKFPQFQVIFTGGAVSLWLVLDFSLCIRPADATANRGLAPNTSRVWIVSPNAFRTGWMALASGWIPDRMSTSRCVMMTLHLGRDDRGKENAVSPPFHTVTRFKLKIGTSL